VLVTDALNFRVQAFDAEGRFLWQMGRQGDAAGDFAAPKGVATDSQGHIYVADALFDSVQIFRHDGALLLAFGERGTAVGQFLLPGGIFINAEDRIYVADAYNGRIQTFDFLRAPRLPEGDASAAP
jgi:DNA-binding beta-propeller fold protein YncE